MKDYPPAEKLLDLLYLADSSQGIRNSPFSIKRIHGYKVVTANELIVSHPQKYKVLAIDHRKDRYIVDEKGGEEVTGDVYRISDRPGKWVAREYGNGYENVETGQFVTSREMCEKGLTVKRVAGIQEVVGIYDRIENGDVVTVDDQIIGTVVSQTDSNTVTIDTTTSDTADLKISTPKPDEYGRTRDIRTDPLTPTEWDFYMRPEFLEAFSQIDEKRKREAKERKETEMGTGNASICDRECCSKTFKADESAMVSVDWTEWYDKTLKGTTGDDGEAIKERCTTGRSERYVLCPGCRKLMVDFLEKKPDTPDPTATRK